MKKINIILYLALFVLILGIGNQILSNHVTSLKEDKQRLFMESLYDVSKDIDTNTVTSIRIVSADMGDDKQEKLEALSDANDIQTKSKTCLFLAKDKLDKYNQLDAVIPKWEAWQLPIFLLLAIFTVALTFFTFYYSLTK
ncbi:hypothetical protein JXA85_00180 [Candidatus Woesearchaeota archaeon]|nr:hypothetical protein [Candidatus Woesearchaeota archaeon]